VRPLILLIQQISLIRTYGIIKESKRGNVERDDNKAKMTIRDIRIINQINGTRQISTANDDNSSNFGN